MQRSPGIARAIGVDSTSVGNPARVAGKKVGASKRGWTTWLVGAVDPTRVMAIIPIVLDAINFVNVEKHQWRSYGGWAYALEVPLVLTMREQTLPSFTICSMFD